VAYSHYKPRIIFWAYIGLAVGKEAGTSTIDKYCNEIIDQEQ